MTNMAGARHELGLTASTTNWTDGGTSPATERVVRFEDWTIDGTPLRQLPAEVQRLVTREYIEPQTALLQKVENLVTYMTDSKAPSARQVDVGTEALVRAEEPIDAFLACEGLQGCIAGPPA